MNRKTVLTDDPFRAAYLLKFGSFQESKFKNNRRVFILEGENLLEEDFKYRTGNAQVNPLVLKESYQLLLELSDVDENEDTELLLEEE